MKEFSDYSGPFVPNIKYEDFSKGVLATLLSEAGRAAVMIDGFWHTLVAETLGVEKADEWGAKVWGEMYTRHVLPRVRNVLNIRDNDLTGWAKYLQMDPGLPLGIYDYDIDLKSGLEAIFTVNRCPSLLFMEREGKGREAVVCAPEGMEHQGIRGYAKAFNPAIKVMPLKTPPRKTGDEAPHCQWLLRIER